MPWSVLPMSEIRLAFVHQVVTLKRPVAEACRRFGVSRKTGYKWLNRYKEAPAEVLADRSRRPMQSPDRTAPSVEVADQ
jgi:transposase